MKKKIAIAITILVLLVLLSPRLYVLSVATWQYSNTDIVCTGRDPTPPEKLGVQFEFPLYEIRPYSVITDKGFMHLGDEYMVQGDGWSGAADLLWAGRNGANFLVMFASKKDYSDLTCRWFTPVGDYR